MDNTNKRYSVNKIKWFKNGLEIPFGNAEHINQMGDLILISPKNSAVFTCGIDDQTLIKSFNITIEPTSSSDARSKQENDVQLHEYFSDWLVKIQNLKTDLKENILNCSSKCEC